MPPFRSLLVVDAEGFGRHPDVELPGVHLEIRDALAEACERSGLGEVWKTARFQQSTGDGVLAVLPAEAMSRLISPFADHLQKVLAEAAPRLRARGVRLRLRVALHVGIVDDADPVTAGISAATVEVSRLLDCRPLRNALENSDPGVTFAAVILSSEVFDVFVRGGHTDLHPSQLTPVQAQVKQFDRPAFLYVPKPSRRESPVPQKEPSAAPPPTAPVPSGGGISFSGVRITGDGNQNSFGNQVSGGYRQERWS